MDQLCSYCTRWKDCTYKEKRLVLERENYPLKIGCGIFHERNLKSLRVVITGSRKFNNYELLKNTATKIILSLLSELEESSMLDHIEIISGDCRGADILSQRFAKEFNVTFKQFSTDWDREGNLAGCIRNEEMVRYASDYSSRGALIAFWDGESKGTKNIIKVADRINLKSYIIKY